MARPLSLRAFSTMSLTRVIHSSRLPGQSSRQVANFIAANDPHVFRQPPQDLHPDGVLGIFPGAVGDQDYGLFTRFSR